MFSVSCLGLRVQGSGFGCDSSVLAYWYTSVLM